MAETACNQRMWDALEPLVDGYIPDPVGAYLEQQSYGYQERLAAGFTQLQECSTPAFRQSLDAVAGAAMPTSFQEAGYVRHALGQYRGQRLDGPHRFVGYLNWPNSLPRTVARDTRAQLDQFIADNPHVPFGYFEDSELAPIAIGAIRKVTTDVLMAVSNEDALLMGHDADQRWLNPTHIYDLRTAHGRVRPPLAGLLPDVTHSRLPWLPNMDHVIRWFEDPQVSVLTGRYFEPGPAFGAPQYRGVGGYNATDNLSETHNLLRGIHESPVVQASGLARVPHARMVISPRRLVQKLNAYSRIDQFWTGGEDFGAMHEYRNSVELEYAHIPDLPEQTRDQRLREYGRQVLAAAVRFAGYDETVTNAQAFAFVELEKLRQELGGPEDMFAD